MSGPPTTAYPPHVRERAVRMVAEMRANFPSERATICAVAAHLGVGSPATLRRWLRRVEVDAREQPGVTADSRLELQRLRRENARLRRSNETLEAALAFAAAPDARQLRW